jgi:hypothetical protein
LAPEILQAVIHGEQPDVHIALDAYEVGGERFFYTANFCRKLFVDPAVLRKNSIRSRNLLR